MAVNQLTVNELYQLSEGSKNISIQTLRTTISYANRKIVTLQKHLQDLKSAFIITLQNINRNLTKEELDKFFAPDRYQTLDPSQVIKPYDAVTPDPDPRVNWVRRRIEEMMGEQKKELYRLEDEIKKVSSLITRLTTQKNKSLEQLAQIEGANIISSRDLIARMQYETIYMLEEISKRYLDLSTDANGNRITSSSAPIVRQYKILSDTFRAYASRDPDVKKGNLHLLLEDPGCPENRAAIKEVLDRRKRVFVDNGGIPPDVQRVTEKMQATINDSFISQNVSRQALEKRIPPAENAVTTMVDNLDKMLGAEFTKFNNILSGLTPQGKNSPSVFGQFINASYDSTGFSEAATNWFNRVMQNNYDGMPLCNQTDTSAAQAKTLDNANMEQAEQDASIMVASQFTKAARKVTTSFSQASTSLSDSLNEVIAVANEVSNSAALWSNTLILDRKTYQSVSYHDGKVLKQATQAANKASEYRNKGDISVDEYQKYITSLQSTIEKGTKCTVTERTY